MDDQLKIKGSMVYDNSPSLRSGPVSNTNPEQQKKDFEAGRELGKSLYDKSFGASDSGLPSEFERAREDSENLVYIKNPRSEIHDTMDPGVEEIPFRKLPQHLEITLKNALRKGSYHSTVSHLSKEIQEGDIFQNSSPEVQQEIHQLLALISTVADETDLKTVWPKVKEFFDSIELKRR